MLTWCVWEGLQNAHQQGLFLLLLASEGLVTLQVWKKEPVQNPGVRLVSKICSNCYVMGRLWYCQCWPSKNLQFFFCLKYLEYFFFFFFGPYSFQAELYK